MPIFDRIQHRRREEAATQLNAEIEKQKQERLPAERAFPEYESQMREARSREAKPEPAREQPEKEAERMAPRPAGMHLQGPPSPGGGIPYVNTRVWKRENNDAQSPRQSLYDRALRQAQEKTNLPQREQQRENTAAADRERDK